MASIREMNDREMNDTEMGLQNVESNDIIASFFINYCKRNSGAKKFFCYTPIKNATSNPYEHTIS
jgi:hypothetical protein